MLSGSLPPDVDENLYARIAKLMPDTCRVILDTSGSALKHGLESPLYLIKPNIHELEKMSDHSIEDDAQIREIAQSLINKGKAEIVITSFGSGGAVLTTARIPSPTVKIRSKVGAGDSMVAGIVFALSQGMALKEATQFGVQLGQYLTCLGITLLDKLPETPRCWKHS